jgi:hypothetical protein
MITYTMFSNVPVDSPFIFDETQYMKIKPTGTDASNAIATSDGHKAVFRDSSIVGIEKDIKK